MTVKNINITHYTNTTHKEVTFNPTKPKTPGKTQYTSTLLISSLNHNKAQNNLAKNLVETFSQTVL